MHITKNVGNEIINKKIVYKIFRISDGLKDILKILFIVEFFLSSKYLFGPQNSQFVRIFNI